MSEQKAEEGGKKKGGKLPLIIGLVVVLGGGGFFMMKKDSGGKKKEPEVVMGKGDGAIIEMEEKLFNLADRSTFLRVTLAFHLKQGFDAGHLTKDVAGAVDDAVFSVMSSKKPDDFFGVVKMRRIKREIAAAVNHQLHHEEPKKEDEKGAKEEKGKGEKPKSSEHGEAKGHAEPKAHGESTGHEAAGEPKHPDWDSDTGPVLKVYVRALAIQ